MKKSINLLLLLLLFSCTTMEEDARDEIAIKGILESVEVIRDENGINHIYAKNQKDLFFAQGYLAAKDRLFQFEIWRRQATGTVAEILGERELKRDIGTRLFKFRGDMEEEMNYYHDEGVEIITKYTEGVNAYIEEVLKDQDQLPVTFKALGILPQPWTPEVVISRHQGLLGNIGTELATGIAVAKLGSDQVKSYSWFHPRDPKLDLDPAIDGNLLTPDILALYNAYRTSVQFLPEDILPEYRTESTATELSYAPMTNDLESQKMWVGSNNWVTRPDLSKKGSAFMANDPHRRLAVPSLRYWAHLNAPGWNVIGGGEPEIPGISIGHNDHGAWGLTVFRTDGEDLYVYDLNPDNLLQYKYKDDWEDMSVIKETIAVKGQDDILVDLRYTRHGPVTLIDSVNLKAYAVRCAWMEPGGSPYLASLRMDQAKTWEEFRAACSYSHIPGENMIWADREGNIGWQSVGIAPIRRNFSGMVPVPGDGRYEWDGYLPIVEKPNVHNPQSGYFITANENVTPDSYDQWDAIGFQWADPFRGDRIEEVLGNGSLTMEDMKRLQTDYLSLPARMLVPLILSQEVNSGIETEAKALLEGWDFRLESGSAAAAAYVAWENELRDNFYQYFPNPEVQPFIPAIQFSRILDWIFDSNSFIAPERDTYLVKAFGNAVNQLEGTQGSDPSRWKYGHEQFKHVKIKHPLGDVVNEELREQLNTQLIPRGGNQYTPGATGSSFNQAAGATFRIIVDVNDWDASVGMNSPGQSGDPQSPYYKNLYEKWAADDFFPVHFSKEKVEANAKERVRLVPE